MAPQPTTPPAQTDADKAKAKREAFEKEWEELVATATSGDSAGARQVARAIELERQRGELMGQIDKNRTYLRLMDANDELSDEQGDFADTFYAEKEKGERRPTEEVERTRLAHEWARKQKAPKSE